MSDATAVAAGSPWLRIDVTDLGDTTYVTPRGEIDLSNAHGVLDALTSAPASERRTVVLDLSEVSFIDSSGIRILLKADAVTRSEGRSLVMANPSDIVGRVLEISGLWDRLPIVLAPVIGEVAAET